MNNYKVIKLTEEVQEYILTKVYWHNNRTLKQIKNQKTPQNRKKIIRESPTKKLLMLRSFSLYVN